MKQRRGPSRKAGNGVIIRASFWGIVSLFVLELGSLFFSQYGANGFHSLTGLAVSMLFYLIAHTLLRSPQRGLLASGLVGLGGVGLALSTTNQFVGRQEALAKTGLTDLVAFRAQLGSPIHHWVPGEGFTALLLTLPFALALFVYFWKTGRAGLARLAFVPPLVITAALCLSLSRAIFWSIILFYLLVAGLVRVYHIFSYKRTAWLLVGAFGSLLLVLLVDSLWYPGIFKAYAGTHATQVRSAQGRLGIWSRSLHLIRDYPLLGVGSSNAGLFLSSTGNAEEGTGFAGRAFSLPIQLLVEKGVVGFTMYGVFLVLVGYEFHGTMRSGYAKEVQESVSSDKRARAVKGRQELHRLELASAHKAMKCCFAAGAVTVLFRELTYSSLLEHSLTLVLFFVLAALACGELSDSK